MHFVPFALKRGHHDCLKMLRPFAARHGLTPARADLLYALSTLGESRRLQCNLAKWLGVTRSTVCKMVRALENGGFLQTKRAKNADGRFRLVSLTRYGRRQFKRILKLIRTHALERPLLHAIRSQKPSRYDRLRYLGVMAERVLRLARGFDDYARLYG